MFSRLTAKSIAPACSRRSIAHYYARKCPVLQFPVKTVEIISLGEENKATVVGLPVQEGSMVHAGDLLAQVKTDNGEIKEIRTPLTGKVVQLSSLNDRVSVGEAAFAIDTDDSSDENALTEHIQKEKRLDDEFLQDLLEKDDDIERLRQLAAVVSERFPNLETKALRIHEHILTLVQDDPQQKANTHTHIGILLFRLGDLDASILQLEESLRLRKETLGDEHPELVASYIHLGAVLKQQGDLDATLSAFQSVLNIQQTALGEDHEQVGATWNNLGAIYHQKGDFKEAVDHYRCALKIHEGKRDADMAGCLMNIGNALKQTGDYAGAVEHCHKGLEIRQSVLDTQHPDLGASYASLAQLLLEMGQFADAVKHFQSALVIQENCHGSEHPITASSYTSLGAAYYMRQDFDKSLEAYQKSLVALETIHGIGAAHPDLVTALNNVGFAQYQKGELDEALASQRRAREVLTRLSA